MPGTFRIGVLSARSGRSIHAIRWYESQGLIPGVRRDSGGRRVYVDTHVGWLDLIDRLRHTGMSIAEMKRYVELVRKGDGTLKQRQKMLAQHREQVRKNIAEQKAALKLIDHKIDFYESWINTGVQPEAPPFKGNRRRRSPRDAGIKSVK
jgi:DNA-binding transcriptional MerR regulator